jgi:phosphoserine aminotransferase
MGLSLLEISHRSKEFVAVMEEARALSLELLDAPAGYKALFLQGGASTQFAMIPMYLLGDEQKAAYHDSGVWANKALKEAKLFGKVQTVGSSKDINYAAIRKDFTVDADARYLHITTNNTIFGTQWQELPASPVPMVGDLSSDIFSRPVDVSRFGLIYAGAQKNMGPAGATLVIFNEEFMGEAVRKVPSMFDYKVHLANDSMYNTPPAFTVFVCLETMKWVKAQGGVKAMQVRNEKKAGALYAEIDKNPLFKGTCAVEDRSRMNVTFVLENPALEDAFLAEAKKANLSGLKGHRSVGGFRASIYNALEQSSIEALTSLMADFAKRNG